MSFSTAMDLSLASPPRRKALEEMDIQRDERNEKDLEVRWIEFLALGLLRKIKNDAIIGHLIAVGKAFELSIRYQIIIDRRSCVRRRFIYCISTKRKYKTKYYILYPVSFRLIIMLSIVDPILTSG